MQRQSSVLISSKCTFGGVSPQCIYTQLYRYETHSVRVIIGSYMVLTHCNHVTVAQPLLNRYDRNIQMDYPEVLKPENAVKDDETFGSSEVHRH
jgi:predicted proteasome-type protease